MTTNENNPAAMEIERNALRISLDGVLAEAERLRAVVARVSALAEEPGSGFPYVQQADLRAALALFSEQPTDRIATGGQE